MRMVIKCAEATAENGTLDIQASSIQLIKKRQGRYYGSLIGDVAEAPGMTQGVCYNVIKVLYLMA